MDMNETTTTNTAPFFTDEQIDAWEAKFDAAQRANSIDEDEDQEWIEICECEIDWKCGLCTEAGAYHSKLDA